MLFTSKNEDGVPAWELVLAGEKTVTRRLKPMAVGKEFAVQPGRGRKSVCRARVVSCVPHRQWVADKGFCFDARIAGEAELEGFRTYAGLLAWFKEHKIYVSKTFRIEFEKL